MEETSGTTAVAARSSRQRAARHFVHTLLHERGAMRAEPFFAAGMSGIRDHISDFAPLKYADNQRLNPVEQNDFKQVPLKPNGKGHRDQV